MLNKICTWTAKSAPYPPCTVTAFWPRWRGVPGLCPDAASGNAYEIIPPGRQVQIFLAQRLSLRTVFNILHLDMKISAHNNEMPIARQTILPSRPHLHGSVNKETTLHFIRTCQRAIMMAKTCANGFQF